MYYLTTGLFIDVLTLGGGGLLAGIDPGSLLAGRDVFGRPPYHWP